MKVFILGLFSIFWVYSAEATTLYTFNGGGTIGNWNDATIWTTDPTGSTSISPQVPGNSDNAVVTNSFTVNLTANVNTTGLNVTVQRGGVLDLKTFAFSSTLSSLSGQGILRIGTATFPSVTTNNFDDANTGTVEFNNLAAGTSALPSPGSGMYNNLRLVNNSTSAITTAFTAQLNNALTVNGSLTLSRASTAVAGSFVTLNIGAAANTARILSVLGDITIGAGTALGVTAGSNTATAPHTLNASGSFVNNGTVNLFTSTTQTALLNFTGTADANFACNGATDLGIMQVDKGVDSQVLLNVTSTTNISGTNKGNLRLNSTVAGDILILKNGICKLGNNVYLSKIHNGTPSPANLTNTSGWFQLGSSTTSPTLWIAGATVIADATDNAAIPNASLFVVYGIYRISAGRMTSENDGGMVIREDAQVLIEGGTTTVNKFRPSSTAATHRGSFTMTGGLFQSTGKFLASSFDDNFSRFSMPYTTQAFRMSGGIIEVLKPNAGDGFFHVGVNVNNATVTGGTIKLFLPDNTNTTDCAILSTAPLYNLSINRSTATGTSKAVLAAITNPSFPSGTTSAIQPLTVLNDFSLGTLYNFPVTFDAAGQTLTIQGSFNIGTASNTSCVYMPNSSATPLNTTTFSGSQDQQLNNYGTIGTGAAGTAMFHNWTIDKSSGTLTLAGSVDTYSTPASTTLSILNGVLNDGNKTINVQGNIINSGSHTGTGSIVMNGATAQTMGGDGTGVYGNLKINNTGLAAGSVAVTLTGNISVSNVLTLQSTHIFAIGAYRLSLTNVGDAIEFGALSNQCMIQTSGNQSDLGLQKTYGGAGTFTFPVGTGTKYTPVTLTLANAVPSGRYGQLSVSPVSMRNPFVTPSGTTNALNYYWKVRSAGFGPIAAGSVNATFRMINTDDATNKRTTYSMGIYQPVAWTTYALTSKTDFGTYTDNRVNGLNQFDGEYTFGTTTPNVFGAVTAYYSRTNGPWDQASTWSTVGFGGAAASAAPTSSNPVFIGSATAVGSPAARYFHTVTVSANGATAGSLVIDRGSVLDVGITTGHNFGALPDSKVGGSGMLRVSSTTSPAVFPGGDFGSFIQVGGGTVEYYTGTVGFTVPTTSNAGSLTLNQYHNLWLNAGAGLAITLPNQNLRVYAQLRTGSSAGTGSVLMSATASGNLRADSLLYVKSGIFRYSNGTLRTVTADTDVKIDAGATFDVSNAGTVVANMLTLGGSLTNNGSLDFNVNTRTAGLTFTGSGNALLTGPTGTLTDLYALTLNKGTGRAPTLSVDVAGTFTTPTNSWLTINNGTLRFAKANGTLTIHDLASTYLLTDNAGLTVDGAGATVTIATNTSAASDLKLAGQLQVLQGTLNVGTSAGAGNDLEYASAGAPALKVGASGNLYVNGQIRRTVNNLDGSLRYDQTGGTVNIDGQGATAVQSNERGLFEVQGVGSMFRMSGGTLNLHRSNLKSPITTPDFYLAPDSTVVTGGTVIVGNATALSPATNVIITLSSTVPLYDLRVESGINNTNTNTGKLAGIIPLTLKGSLTIGNDNSFFNANGLGLNIGQSLINNNTSASTALVAPGGGFLPGTVAQTTTFFGGIPTQLLTGTASNLTTFGSVVLNTPQTNGTLQLGGNARVAGSLTLTKGTLDDDGKTITVLGDVLTSATHTSGGPGTGSLILAGAANQNIGGNGTGRFGNLTLNNGFGATTTAKQEITQVLTLANGVLTIGSNLLYLSNPAADAVAGTFDLTHYIRTDGIVADLGVRKAYPSTPLNFTFPVGAATTYTPVVMNVTANSAPGTITVQPIALAHPSLTGTGANKITFYWKVTSTLSSPTVSQQFTYGASDVVGTESTYKVGRFYNGGWLPAGPPYGITASSATPATHTLSNPGFTGASGTIDGDYTGADPSEFGPVPTFYSRNATAGLAAGAIWTNTSAWTYNADGTDSSPLPVITPTLANPVVIRPGHLITSGSAGRGAATLTLNGTLDLGTYAANNFNNVSGTGTLRIGSALFPAGNYTNFVAPNTGNVEFTAAVQLPARDTYNNLTLSGGASAPKQLTNLDLTINGGLTVAANTQVDNSTSQNITLMSASGGATINGTLNLNDGNLTTSASVTTGSTGILNLGAGAVVIGTTLTNGGTLTQSSGNVQVGTSLTNSGTYNGSTGAVVVGTTFTSSGDYNAGTGDLNVAGDLTNAANGNFTATGGEVNAGGFSNAGSYLASTNNLMHVNGDFTNLATGLFDAGNSNIVLRSNFTNRGSFTASTSLVQFITDVNRLISGTTTFYDLQKLGSSTLSLGTSTDVHVNDLLTIQNNIIYTGANTLYLDNSSIQPIVGNTLTSYINGRLAMAFPNVANSTRVYPVGTFLRYRPVTIKNIGGSSGATVLVEIVNASPTGTIDNTLQNLSANRYYRIQTVAGTITQPTIQLSFNTDIEDERVNVPGNLRVAKSSSPSGPWSTAGGLGVYSPDAPKGYTISASGQTAITNTSFFAIGSTNQVDNPLTGSLPLPVELLQFTATRQETAVAVTWTTASEKNSAYFQVQRSADGRTFANLQQVEAQGSSLNRHDYALLDSAPLAAVNYYRLRQVDKDGTATYSPIIAVHFDGQPLAPAPTLVAYPNPASGQGFQLLTTGLSTTSGTVRVFDNVGRVVLTKVMVAGTVETTVQPARPLASGVYFVTWQTTDGVQLRTKVTVE